MALFCAAIRSDSVSILRYHFCSHALVISYKILSVCRLKYPHSCSSHFFSLVFLPLFVLMLVVLLMAIVIIFSMFFSMQSFRHRIDASTQASILLNTLHPFLDTYSLSMSSLVSKALCVVIIFLSFGPFDCVYPCLFYRYSRRLLRCLSLWLDFSCWV